MARSTGLVMHIDGELDVAKRRELEDTICLNQGVSSAQFNDRRPHLIVVEYDPEQISYHQIMHEVACRNLHAERVG